MWSLLLLLLLLLSSFLPLVLAFATVASARSSKCVASDAERVEIPRKENRKSGKEERKKKKKKGGTKTGELVFLATTYLGRETPSFRFRLNWSKVFVKSRFPRDVR